jgi:hypothetical protein
LAILERMRALRRLSLVMARTFRGARDHAPRALAGAAVVVEPMKVFVSRGGLGPFALALRAAWAPG